MAKWHWHPQHSGRRTMGVWLLALALAGGAWLVVMDALRLALPPVYVVGVGMGVMLGGMAVGMLAIVFALLDRLWRPAVNVSRYICGGFGMLLGVMSQAPAEIKIIAALHLVLTGDGVLFLGFAVLMGLFLQLTVFSLFLATYDAVSWSGIWAWNRFVARGGVTCRF